MTVDLDKKISARRQWATFVFVYLLDLMSMATIGIIVPNVANFAERFGSDASSVGFAMSLFSLPTAIFAMIAGSVIDRIGFRRALGFGLALFVVGQTGAYFSASIVMFYAALFVVGIGYLGLAVSCPAILISTLSGGIQVRAMSLLATCPPTGYALGLLIAGPLATGPDWAMVQVFQAIAMLALMPGIALLPKPQKYDKTATTFEPRPNLLALVRSERRVLWLAVACALPGFISYGTSLVSPSYLASVHDISIASSSVTVAIVKVLVAVVSSLAIGQLLARSQSKSKAPLYLAMAAIGLSAQFLLFLPSIPLALAVISLFVWLVAFGGMAGTAMASLPDAVSSPARAGISSGIVSQMIALVSFIAPTVYFASTSWLMFVSLAAVGLSLACLGIVMSLGTPVLALMRRVKIAENPI
jgi:MFS family permease